MKHAGRTARIAGCLHLLRTQAGGELSAEDMQGAVSIGRYLESHARAAFEQSWSGAKYRAAFKVWRALQNHPEGFCGVGVAPLSSPLSITVSQFTGLLYVGTIGSNSSGGSGPGYLVVEVNPDTGVKTVLSGCTNNDGCGDLFEIGTLTGSGPLITNTAHLATDIDGSIVAGFSSFGFSTLIRINPSSGNRTMISGCTDRTCSTVIGQGPRREIHGVAVVPGPSLVPALSPTGLAILGLLLMALVAVSMMRRRATA